VLIFLLGLLMALAGTPSRGGGATGALPFF
jgi:hypothetical protein